MNLSLNEAEAKVTHLPFLLEAAGSNHLRPTTLWVSLTHTASFLSSSLSFDKLARVDSSLKCLIFDNH